MTQIKQVTLYSYHFDNSVTLAEAINNCRDVLEGAIALLYSPQACQFLKLMGGIFHNADGEVKKLSDVFEARIFTEQCELRWLNRNSGEGDAILLSESEQSLEKLKSINSKCCEALKQCEALEKKYLLWGETAKNQPQIPGWKTLSEARIGKLDIPFDGELKQKQRVYLKTREYLTSIDEYDNVSVYEYGNVAVIEERLVKLEVA